MKTRKIIIYGISILLTLLLVSVYIEKPFIDNDDLFKLTITTKENIKPTSGRYPKYGYSFLASEYPSKFTIDHCINFVCDKHSVEEIKSGDKLEIMVNNYFKDNFGDIETEIPIFSLTINNNEIFSPKSYLVGKRKQNYRLVALLSILILALTFFNIGKIKPAISWTILIGCIITLWILIEMKIL